MFSVSGQLWPHGPWMVTYKLVYAATESSRGIDSPCVVIFHVLPHERGEKTLVSPRDLNPGQFMARCHFRYRRLLAKSHYGTTSDNENGVGYPGSWNLCSWCPYRRHFDFATFVIGGSLQKSHCGVVRFLLTPSDNEMAKSNNHIMVTWRPKIYVGLQSEVVKLELSQLLK